jgi:hypothetical protein
MAISKKPRGSGQKFPTTPPQRDARDDYEKKVSDLDDVLEDIVNNAKEFSVLDPGRYEAIVQDIKQEQTDKGIRLVVTYAVFTEENPCWRHVQFFQLTEPDCRTPNEWGPVFFARLMGKLGYEKGKRGPKVWEEISEQKPGVTLKISPSKQEGFVNTSVEGLLDDDNENVQIIREALDTHPF